MAGSWAALGFTVVATIAYLGQDAPPWIAAAFVLYLVAFAVTIAVNVPLNDAIKAAGDPDRIADLAAVRQRFDEARWTSWNLVRVATSTVAFGLHAWALVPACGTMLSLALVCSWCQPPPRGRS